MSSRFSYDNRCPRCSHRGHVFWAESGYRDQHERITAIWGEFKELPSPVTNLFGGRQRGPVVCARCGQPEADGPRTHIVDSTPDRPPDGDLAAMTAYVTITPLDGALVVRIWPRGELAAEAKLAPRRAVLLAQDALNGAVAVGYRTPGPDQQVLDHAGQGRVADPRCFSHGGSEAPGNASQLTGAEPLARLLRLVPSGHLSRRQDRLRPAWFRGINGRDRTTRSDPSC